MASPCALRPLRGASSHGIGFAPPVVLLAGSVAVLRRGQLRAEVPVGQQREQVEDADGAVAVQIGRAPLTGQSPQAASNASRSVVSTFPSSSRSARQNCVWQSSGRTETMSLTKLATTRQGQGHRPGQPRRPAAACRPPGRRRQRQTCRYRCAQIVNARVPLMRGSKGWGKIRPMVEISGA